MQVPVNGRSASVLARWARRFPLAPRRRICRTARRRRTFRGIARRHGRPPSAPEGHRDRRRALARSPFAVGAAARAVRAARLRTLAVATRRAAASHRRARVRTSRRSGGRVGSRCRRSRIEHSPARRPNAARTEAPAQRVAPGRAPRREGSAFAAEARAAPFASTVRRAPAAGDPPAAWAARRAARVSARTLRKK